MAANRRTDDRDAALARARRVHLACEQFEAQWRLGQQIPIEEILKQNPADDHPLLFEELLGLEVELRLEAGEDPDGETYEARFPQFRSIIRSILPDAEAPGDDLESTVAWNSRDFSMLPVRAKHDDASAATDAGTGERIGDYVLIEEIARGGMGIVYRAREVTLKREVALKMILAGSSATPAERARFRREAELAANLDHPNIVPIHEVREHKGSLYFTMKLIHGQSLADCMPQYRANPREAAQLMVKLARAVQYAHERGFFHCDLKPSNILIDRDGEPWITDFGLARRTSEDSTLTATGAILGTPSYMAPEQASGNRQSIGPATDVYGLGAILYQILTGKPPFRTPTVMETIVQILERDPAPPREIVPEIPRELETICLKCLEKLPEDRYRSADELADDLGHYLRGELVEATGMLQGIRRWTRREPEMVSRLGGLALIAALTEFNHRFTSPHPDASLHLKIQGTLLLWMALAVTFQLFWRKGWRSDRVQMLWATSDIFCLTLVIQIIDQLESTLLVGYPLMIAASGLWFRVRLVWFTTILSILGYLYLYLITAIDWSRPFPAWTEQDRVRFPNIYLAALVLTGFVVARQLNRTLALSQYYEQRPPGEWPS